MTRAFAACCAIVLPLLSAAHADYVSARQKFQAIEGERLKPGTRVSLTGRELSAYARQEVINVVPEGLRNTEVQLGNGTATASALVDFAKLQRAQGKPPGWLMSRVLEGERPVRVTAAITSGGGRATIDVQKVEISGIVIDGAVLDYLIRNYLFAVYPQAKVGEPFNLGHRIERLEVLPSAVGIVIGR
jgi:hypothetical protein